MTPFMTDLDGFCLILVGNGDSMLNYNQFREIQLLLMDFMREILIYGVFLLF